MLEQALSHFDLASRSIHEVDLALELLSPVAICSRMHSESVVDIFAHTNS